MRIFVVPATGLQRTKLNRKKQSMAKKKETPVKKKAVKKSTAAGVATKTTAKSSGKSTPTKKSAPKKAVKTTNKNAKTVKSTGKSTPKPALKAVPKAKVEKDKTQLLADAVVEGILEVKGRNISILNLTGIHNRVCDYFIICQADSSTQVQAIAGSVEEMVKKRVGERPYRSEGFENSEWILVDYVTVVVHIFQSHIRNFYNLESLWADAEVTEVAFDKY